MGLLLVLSLLVGLGISAFFTLVSATIHLRGNKLTGIRPILLALACGLFAVGGWFWIMRFPSWLSDIQALRASERASAIIPWLFAVGLTPGVAAIASLMSIFWGRRRDATS
ncbi:MAG: hypothetical protein KDB03_26775 [Planctomycetales bacterium]|nr:hypothetical protein [Planctomycetales bacterium]